MAEVSPEEARAGISARTAARAPAPRIDKVFDLVIPGLDAGIPVRICRPKGAIGVTMAFHGGGWLMGSRDSFDAVCRQFRTYALDHGVTPTTWKLSPFLAGQIADTLRNAVQAV
ncbi:alpha/beta hydrolase family protein [Paraburkholderia elongata]|uniref:hypothetical protein n=1 Tax=Paraburkholderia elongata TaxID=2675747 RepID=UPI001C131525|nr:hypothetical protein [Paraburkholderia elongata]